MLDLDLEKGVPFDPGYSNYLEPFTPNIEAIKAELKKQRNFNQRKMRFNSLNKFALELLDNNVSFYLGCILWGAYISTKFKNEPKDILNNSFLNMSPQDLKKLDHMVELNSILEFIENYPKDTKYYTGKEQDLPKFYRKITAGYKEFVEVNENFLQVKTTADIKLPSNFEFLKDYSEFELEEIYGKILEATQNGKLEELFVLDLVEKL